MVTTTKLTISDTVTRRDNTHKPHTTQHAHLSWELADIGREYVCGSGSRMHVPVHTPNRWLGMAWLHDWLHALPGDKTRCVPGLRPLRTWCTVYYVHTRWVISTKSVYSTIYVLISPSQNEELEHRSTCSLPELKTENAKLRSLTDCCDA